MYITEILFNSETSDTAAGLVSSHQTLFEGIYSGFGTTDVDNLSLK